METEPCSFPSILLEPLAGPEPTTTPKLREAEREQIERDVKRTQDVDQKQLSQILERLFGSWEALHYVQGYNDVCATLLRILPFEHAYHVAEKIGLFWLRDALLPTFDTFRHWMNFTWILVAHVSILEDKPKNLWHIMSDPERQLRSGVVVSWLNTMFSREINDDEIIKLIWTFLFNNEGCMLLYVAAALLLENDEYLVVTLENVDTPHNEIKALPTTFSARCGVAGWRRVLNRAKTLHQSYSVQAVIDLSSIEQFKDWDAVVKLDPCSSVLDPSPLSKVGTRAEADVMLSAASKSSVSNEFIAPTPDAEAKWQEDVNGMLAARQNKAWEKSRNFALLVAVGVLGIAYLYTKGRT